MVTVEVKPQPPGARILPNRVNEVVPPAVGVRWRTRMLEAITMPIKRVQSDLLEFVPNATGSRFTFYHGRTLCLNCLW